ncbi:CwfJ domain-containing protein [Trichophyton tonsurans CBS 112818]|uniref:CwfJ domain-containing protein n=1 Tax=Trichophyton tonsurans (strain CBS 112818) TaxID=647933 RepID=F2S4E8_TRIT1|nr:CwfJ domain-containing protein [Trichophyton tonsurans CBS 112818]
MASKVIVVGGVNSFREVFGKLEKLQAKQQFACAIIAGDLFGELSTGDSKDDLSALLRGVIHVALPTYFTVGRNGIPDEVAEKLTKDDEVCTNLFYLGRRGVLTTSEGIKIVALGGIHGPLPSDASVNEKYLPYHTEADAQSLQDDGQQRPAKRARKAAPGPSECFFCLSNPNIASHLIASIGNDTYITTAKGPLPTASTFPALGFPGHILIIPLIHAPSLASIEDPESKSATYAEVQKYRSTLHSMLQRKADVALGSVTWEVSWGRGVHIHWQFMPVDASLVRRGLVEASFKVEAENLKYPKLEKRESRCDEPDDYFRVWIWAPGQAAEGDATGSETTLVLPLSDRFRFDVQFGRTVMAKLLGLEDRLNWRDASQSTEEEKKDVEAFKGAFKDFDFTV